MRQDIEEGANFDVGGLRRLEQLHFSGLDADALNVDAWRKHLDTMTLFARAGLQKLLFVFLLGLLGLKTCAGDDETGRGIVLEKFARVILLGEGYPKNVGAHGDARLAHLAAVGPFAKVKD